ncbi:MULTISPECIES: PTS glucitol/sorbitol transporter subunit IIA [Brenneria]|uniref:PTS glucitol/sorbitol transporter subunit IIA n=2 Tax=Brenneria TaxID=71655 RepID=A0A2U1UPC4_9GAMM|nr:MULTISPECIES: PTS glucitol/sorbitol transporter subunit IIA [Brenneria]EHD23493.1 PTS system glucitol/sorbitol-specific IIA component [Brenneria sp. EniD312]PWC12935.1 PTS glucitol/sorbitol transporter subunit IIA [Brenneria sp. CFCC 11842]PWC23422.1 PTS glucitol/sorbitol transporter subunit IIA [Brenneria nigrifluens DSM 30175 = ATCC 13028]QCR06420.1 PTS glucitol/sorbitol transporter subunit IIA [Brenneria nigrifluens DSM 30175 = ATCC 13028]
MNTVFQTIFTRIGDNAAEALTEDMMITFREGAPEDIESFCFIHQHGDLHGELRAGDTLMLSDRAYPITAVGSVATQNLRELGHITIRFDGAAEAEFPGSLHVAGKPPTDIQVGGKLTIFS